MKIITLIFYLFTCSILAQNTSSPLEVNKNSNNSEILEKKTQYRPLILPSAYITYGFIGLKNERLKALDLSIRDELRCVERKVTLDDYLAYSPLVAVYGLNLLGKKGVHDLRELSKITGYSIVMTGVSVASIKLLTGKERPDESDCTSFPSGHTATAFMCAEILYQEYKDESILYGILGYTAAATTGYLRVYNDKHWFSDVVAGAGFGILSTKLSYLLHKKLNSRPSKSSRTLSRNKRRYLP
jgi:hypothetical protein